MTKLSREYPRSLWSSNHVSDHTEASGAYCFRCSTYLTWAQYFAIGENFLKGVRLRHPCGGVLNYGITRPDCTDETLRKYSDSSTYEQVWYHATQKRDWLEKLDTKSRLVHIGDELTALSRADSLYSEIKAPTYLYSFRISTEKIRYTTLLKDEDSWPTFLTPNTEMVTVDGISVNHEPGYNAYPYQNLFENPGSISLLAEASIIVEDTVSVKRLVRR